MVKTYKLFNETTKAMTGHISFQCPHHEFHCYPSVLPPITLPSPFIPVTRFIHPPSLSGIANDGTSRHLTLYNRDKIRLEQNEGHLWRKSKTKFL